MSRFKILNGLHPALKLTCEHETIGCLPFMDVLVRKDSENGVTTSVHRKHTFTGLYITWDSFCATKYKINLVRNLVERAHRICSESTLDEELRNLKSIFEKNGYPADLLSKLVCRRPEKSEQQHGPKRCPMYLRLPWKGPWSSSFARTIASTARSAYYAVDVNCVYTTSRAFSLRKDVLPSHHQSNLIYEFECRNCKSRYVGKTSQRLNARIRQHVPLHLLLSSARSTRPTRGRPRKTPTAEPSEGCPQALSTKRVSRPRACKAQPAHNEPSNVTQTEDMIAPPAPAAKRVCPPRACKSTPVGPCKSSMISDTEDAAHYQSSIAKHLASNRDCAMSYDDSSFRVVHVCKSRYSLGVLEALYIRSLSPDLCVQKNSVTSLVLFRT